LTALIIIPGLATSLSKISVSCLLGGSNTLHRVEDEHSTSKHCHNQKVTTVKATAIDDDCRSSRTFLITNLVKSHLDEESLHYLSKKHNRFIRNNAIGSSETTQLVHQKQHNRFIRNNAIGSSETTQSVHHSSTTT